MDRYPDKLPTDSECAHGGNYSSVMPPLEILPFLDLMHFSSMSAEKDTNIYNQYGIRNLLVCKKNPLQSDLWTTKLVNLLFSFSLNPLPDMPILGSSNSAANKDMM